MIVEVGPYNPNSANEYKKEKNWLIEALGDIATRVHHIGSTSVRGLSAKPIIDILLEARSVDSLDNISTIFEVAGYEVMGEIGIGGRRYYRRGGNHRTHQIHAFEIGDPNVHRHLAFRDYLAAHPNEMAEYQELKIQLARTCNHDIEVHCAGKDRFIKHHESVALRWAPSPWEA